tara:strand:- start:18847 stop:20259 length:1413 start_codon:yes stop_codon:yes gene_type:complete
MNDFETVIGLEVHAQLKTMTKLFSTSNNEFGDNPNSNVSIVDLGLPGVLPVLNMEAVRLAIIAGLSTDCKINKKSTFARKHYFYPDLPKGYQISQYDEPIASSGILNIKSGNSNKKIRINRIHMEEDAGKLIHDLSDDLSLVDLNRAGVPLIEIVTEPDLSNPEEAVSYLKRLRKILLFAGVSDCDMEKGNFRCDANISLRKKGDAELGVKTEIKNVNSFRFVQKALEYEIIRQKKILEKGDEVLQETRLFNSSTNKTYSMRSKEDAHDYRYFPDPDLQPLILDEKFIKDIKTNLGTSYDKKYLSMIDMGLKDDDVDILMSDLKLLEYFEKTILCINEPKMVCNWIISELIKYLDNLKLQPEIFAELIKLIKDGSINNNSAKNILEKISLSNQNPIEVVESMNLKQESSEDSLNEIILKTIDDFPEEYMRIMEGEVKLLSFFMGQAMKLSKGKGNPKIINKLLKEKFKIN